MSGDDLILGRPRDVAAVWGTAVGQLVEIGFAMWRALLQMGSPDEDLPPDDMNEFTVRLVGGTVPKLAAEDLRGETFGELVAGRRVTFTPGPATETGFVQIRCRIDENGPRIRGDIYRGCVVDEQRATVVALALDGGS